MAQSLAKILVHVIFSTKQRHPWIHAELREELHAYLVGTAKAVGSPSLIVNTMPDHAHILLSLSRTLSISEVLEEVKKSSSKWMKTKSDSLRDFYWQNGYGAFSVSPSNVEEVRQYIATQEAHHRRMTFQEEFRAFLTRHGVEFDERYVWD